MSEVQGLHHITAISGPAQENLEFYVGLLGLRLVKKSVNQDDPSTFHLFYADAVGHPGTDLTFFPSPRLGTGRRGHGMASGLSLAVPPGSLSWWQQRLESAGVGQLELETRFGLATLSFADPHGLELELVESESSLGRTFSPWMEGPVPEEHQIRGLDGARLEVQELGPSVRFLELALGYRELGVEGEWHRWGVGDGGSGCYLDLHQAAAAPRGSWGVGSIHHLAFRVRDEAHQLEMRALAQRAGAMPTRVIDRFWFQSVYFREPGGVLFELATDGPGFAIDEAPEALGETLVLPPWLEAQRQEIEDGLPRLTPPTVVAAKG